MHSCTLTHAHTHTPQGIACDLDSPAFKKLDEATREVLGESNPYSITGSLPLVGDLQEAGFDVQVGLVIVQAGLMEAGWQGQSGAPHTVFGVGICRPLSFEL